MLGMARMGSLWQRPRPAIPLCVVVERWLVDPEA